MLVCALFSSLASLLLAAGAATDAQNADLARGLVEGEPVANVELPTLVGDLAPLLGEDEAVSVFVFFKPEQEHSRSLLADVSGLQREFAGEPVHWAAVVSDRFDKARSADLFAALGLEIPLLFTVQDSLFGALDVALLPVVGVTDNDHILRAYLPYRKVNYAAAIAAHVRHALGEISAEELAEILSPHAVVQGGRDLEARRCLKLAQKLFESGRDEMALAQALKSLERDSTLVGAYDLVGKIRLAQEDFVAAALAFEKAIALSPEDSTAQAGLQACRGGP